MKLNLLRSKVAFGWILILSNVLSVQLRAESHVFTIDSASSTVTLSGFANVIGFGSFSFNTQSVGSLTTSYSGTVTVDLDDFNAPTAIQFLSSNMVAAVNGQWTPANGASTGAVPAPSPAQDGNYGISTSFGVAKLRGVVFDVSSPSSTAVTAGSFISTNQQWKHTAGIMDLFTPLGPTGNTQPLTAIAGVPHTSVAGNGSVSVVGSTATLTIPVSVTIGWGIPGGAPPVLGDFVYNGTIVATATVAAPAPILIRSRPYHNSFAGPDKVDTGVSLIERNNAVQQAQLENIISSTQGINGVVLDFDNLADLNDIDLQFNWSPQNVFTQPINEWESVAATATTSLLPDAGHDGGDRVLITWANGSIVDRYLCIRVIHNDFTIAELYLGHLRGEMTGASGDKFTILVGDILAVRSDLTMAKPASGRTDVDKSGTVLVQDILDTRSNLAKELTQISVPALP
ncbi:MAG TPA: hypothetical protein DCF63_03200 [Planctomycetaceae bacterium]|nr:hypothetical protein [Planctomycetaceae bacterium]